MRRDVVRLVRQSVVLTFALVLASCTDDYGPMQPTLRPSYVTPTGMVTANPPIIFTGAGDISSCSNTGDEATAKLLDAIPEGYVYNIGDDAYQNGTTSEFACYNSTWGRHKARTYPTTGNHEYNTSGATGYYQYFGAAAHPSSLADSAGFYSFDLGAWHIISLNSSVARSAGSRQDKFLVADLAAHPNQCTLAYWHHPLYSSGSSGSGQSIASMRPFWDRLYAAHADLVLNGHRHFYDRMALMKPDGSADPTNGIRTIIAGMGGIGGGNVSGAFPTSQVRNGDTFGVLKLYLYDDSYAWKFVPVTGKTFTDSGSTACHAAGGGGGGPVVSATNSTVSASPTSFTAGSGSSTITVTARDGSNATMASASVSVSSSGSGNTFTPSSGTTDNNGVFTSTLTSTVAEGKTISANINSTAITQTASVTVNSGGGGGGGGTISQALLAAGGDGLNQKVYTTASISPAANALVTVAVLGRSGSAPITPTIAGGGMSTWAQVASVDFNTIATPASRVVVFRAMSASPGSGPITITYSSSQSNAQWLVSQWTGVDQTGSNGSGAIGQTGPAQGNSVTTLNVPLAAFANANNVGFGLAGAAGTVTPGSGFTETGEGTSGESMVIEGEWGTNKNAIAASWASSNAGMLGLEIKAGTPSGPVVSPSFSSVAVSPASITAGGSGSLITVTAKDASNNPITGATVVLSVTGSNNALTPLGLTDGSGQATSTLTSTKAENKTVSVTINGVAINQQQTVSVTPGTAAVLAFSLQPTNAQANAPIAPAVVVQVRDAYSNLVNSSATVGMAIGTNPGSGTLGGTTSQVAVGGVATFSDLSINNTGNGYTLTASSSPLTDATSSTFNITPPQPSATNSTVSAVTPSFTAGGSSAINIVVKDGLGNAMSGVTVTLSSSVGGDVITQPATTDGSGATSGTVAATVAGSHTITAAVGATTFNQKPVLTVSAGSPDAGQSSFTASPLTITQTTGTSNLTVTVRDQYGNPVSGANVSFSANPSAGVAFGGGGSTNSSGVATGTMTSSVAEVKTLTALAGGLSIIQTQDVTVTPPSSGITQTLLTAGSDITNQKVYTTASITPVSNALITIAVIGHNSSAAAASPTIAGAGLTWVEVTSTTFNSIATPLKRMTIFRAMSAAPGSGTITITFPASQSNAAWIVSQWTGVDQTGTNGSGAVGTIATPNGSDAATSLSATLAPLGGPNNVAYGVVGTNGSALGINPGGSFAEISEQKPAEGTNSIIEALFAANQTNPSANWTGSFAAAILAVEIKAGP